MTSGEYSSDGGVPVYAVILAGGGGTRFWPLSTRERPKQFLRLFDESSLLQHAYARAVRLVPAERVLVVTGARYAHAVRLQLPDFAHENVLAEPTARDTAAAIAYALGEVRARASDAVMAVLTADHMIRPAEAFARVMGAAFAAAREDEETLFTFGVHPTYAATGYGYLERGEGHATQNGRHRVASFKEKPSREVAEGYVATGRYFWNSGMFVWRASALANEMSRVLPEHARFVSDYALGATLEERQKTAAEQFGSLPRISIDYGVMEKARRVDMFECHFDWLDVGGWLALRQTMPEDGESNVAHGLVTAVESRGNFVFSDDPDELIALVGAEDLVVVRTGRRTLVAHKSRLEEIKKLVERLEREGLEQS